MATYDEIEKSVAASAPIELYEFTAQSLILRYTSGPLPVTNAGFTYLPRAIARDNIVCGSDNRAKLQGLTITASDLLAQMFIPQPPPISVGVRVFRIQPDETPAPVLKIIFSGSIRATEFIEKLNVVKFSMVSLESERTRTLPRDMFSALCNNQVYDGHCRAVAADHQFTGLCIASSQTASGNTIEVVGSGEVAHKWKGGSARQPGSSDIRMIILQGGPTVSDDTLTIVYPFNESPVGKLILLTAGCDHQLQGDCTKVFDNANNFRGFAYTPTRAIFSIGLT